MGKQENGHIILLFLGWNNFCWAGVEVESELETESIFSGGSRSRSRLKFVDSAALVVTQVSQFTYDLTIGQVEM